jgi:hypothetical protein
MKSGHGGRRAGAGRKSGGKLNLMERIVIGAEFDREWRKVQEAEGRDKYYTVARNADDQHEIERQQEKLRDARAHLTQPQQKNIAKKRWKKVDAALDKIGRPRSMPLKRPRGQRATVTAEVVNWWNQQFPKKRITARYVKTCHDEYRKFLRDKSEPDEKEELDAILEWQNLTSPEKS